MPRSSASPAVFDTDVYCTLAEVADSMVRGRVDRVFVVEDKKGVRGVSALQRAWETSAGWRGELQPPVDEICTGGCG